VKKEIKLGLIQSIGVTIYCGLVGSVMQNGSKIFGEVDTFMTPIFILTLFCVSVLVCALIVFEKPYELFFDNKKKEAINVVIYTAVSLFVIILVLFGSMLLLK
jgi:branched-subunit amino acid permease